MAVTKAKKAEQIEKLNSQLQNASSMIVGSFSKLTVAKDYELRKTVRSAGGRYQVVKNTLAKRASEGTRVAEALKGLKGVSSIAYTDGDPVALAKALNKYVEDNPEFAFKSGILDGKALSLQEIKPGVYQSEVLLQDAGRWIAELHVEHGADSFISQQTLFVSE